MIIVPLILSSIVTGVAGLQSAASLGRMGGKTLLYYISTSLLAILAGLLLVNLIRPGDTGGRPFEEVFGMPDFDVEQARLADSSLGDLIPLLAQMIPENPVQAAMDGDILALIFFSLIFGFMINALREPYKELIKDLFEALFQIMLRMTHLVIRFAPIGVFGIIAQVVANTGVEAFKPLAKYFFTVMLALSFHAFITLPLILRVIGKGNMFVQYRAVAPALGVAFLTCSSAAALPLTIRGSEEKLKISKRTTNFVLPIGATVNMDGTALYECVAVIFIAQAYGYNLNFEAQFIVVITALLASIGAAAVPSAGLVMMTIILNALHLPLETVGLILAVDRPLDMFRTSVNVLSDSCGTAVIAASEGEKTVYIPD
jgi:Na+/H+-dicarboxylate symporter